MDRTMDRLSRQIPAAPLAVAGLAPDRAHPAGQPVRPRRLRPTRSTRSSADAAGGGPHPARFRPGWFRNLAEPRLACAGRAASGETLAGPRASVRLDAHAPRNTPPPGPPHRDSHRRRSCCAGMAAGSLQGNRRAPHHRRLAGNPARQFPAGPRSPACHPRFRRPVHRQRLRSRPSRRPIGCADVHAVRPAAARTLRPATSPSRVDRRRPVSPQALLRPLSLSDAALHPRPLARRSLACDPDLAR
jgi:hypothetical protein